MRISLLLVITLFWTSVMFGCASAPLHHAIIMNDNRKAVELVERDKSILSKEDGNGQTPLVLASIYTREDMIQSMLQSGADPNLAATKGGTPLTEAAYKGYLPIIELLLNNGAKADMPQKDGWTPLHFAVKQNFYPVSKLLIRRGADANIQNKNGLTPLHLASLNGYTAIVRLLLASGANPDARDNDGKTALMLAASQGFKTIVQDLIQKGADSQALSNSGKNASDLAEENGFTDIAEQLKVPLTPDVNDGDAGNLPKIILGEIDSELNNKEILPSSIRALELRSSIGHFLDMLCESGKFGQVDTFDDSNPTDDAVFLSLKICETEDRNIGANTTKAFFSGLLTLGLIPPSADYGYRSELTIVAARSDGRNKEYTASSDTTASWRGDPRTAAYIKRAQNASESARKLVIHQAFESLISKLEADDFIKEK